MRVCIHAAAEPHWPIQWNRNDSFGLVYSKLDFQWRNCSFLLHTRHSTQSRSGNALADAYDDTTSTSIFLSEREIPSNDRSLAISHLRCPFVFECSCLMCNFALRVNCVYWITDCDAIIYCTPNKPMNRGWLMCNCASSRFNVSLAHTHIRYTPIVATIWTVKVKTKIEKYIENLNCLRKFVSMQINDNLCYCIPHVVCIYFITFYSYTKYVTYVIGYCSCGQQHIHLSTASAAQTRTRAVVSIENWSLCAARWLNNTIIFFSFISNLNNCVRARYSTVSYFLVFICSQLDHEINTINTARAENNEARPQQKSLKMCWKCYVVSACVICMDDKIEATRALQPRTIISKSKSTLKSRRVKRQRRC